MQETLVDPMSRKISKLVHTLNQRLTVILGAYELGAYDTSLKACSEAGDLLQEMIVELNDNVRVAAVRDAEVARKWLSKKPN